MKFGTVIMNPKKGEVSFSMACENVILMNEICLVFFLQVGYSFFFSLSLS